MHHCPSLVRGRRTAQRGLTMVELMVVVVIVGILATVASVSVKKYVASSKTTEAIHMIGAIKAAQESFKDETFAYLPVSNEREVPLISSSLLYICASELIHLEIEG